MKNDNIETSSQEQARARFAVVVCGDIGSERYPTREAAQREADRLNEESDEELGYEVWGDGAASVIEVES